MRALNVTVLLREDTAFSSQPFVSSNEDRVLSSLSVGEYEVAVLGPPAALRRLAWEAIAAAEDAEQLEAGRVMSGANGGRG